MNRNYDIISNTMRRKGSSESILFSKDKRIVQHAAPSESAFSPTAKQLPVPQRELRSDDLAGQALRAQLSANLH